jgi:hypothetical protein
MLPGCPIHDEQAARNGLAVVGRYFRLPLEFSDAYVQGDMHLFAFDPNLL